MFICKRKIMYILKGRLWKLIINASGYISAVLMIRILFVKFLNSFIYLRHSSQIVTTIMGHNLDVG